MSPVPVNLWYVCSPNCAKSSGVKLLLAPSPPELETLGEAEDPDNPFL